MLVEHTNQHKTKGNNYKVLSIANLDATPERKDEFPIYVTYQNLDDNKIWGSKIEDFKNRVIPYNEDDDLNIHSINTITE